MSPLPAEERAIVLACSSLAHARGLDTPPLSAKEWNIVSQRATAGKVGVGGLLGMSASEIESQLRVATDLATRLQRLLARDGQLTLELERLDRLGIWVLTIASGGYPARLRERLEDSSPAVLFGLGDRSLLDRDGLAVVGSRNADSDSLESARECGRLAARRGWALVSGAARGVDLEAMRGAFEAGGAVIGVTPDGVERYLRDVSLRSAFMEGRAVYLSPYRPDARFSVGNAMGRNKLIYCLARLAIVVDSTAETGGTWAGAVEALAKRWVPVYVRKASKQSGNSKLLSRGGLPLDVAADDLDGLALAGAAGSVPPDGERELVQQALF